MASERSLTFKVVKIFLVLISVLNIIGSFYVGSASSKIIGFRQQFNDTHNPYRLKRMQLSIWWFITVCTLALQDFTALVGIFGAFKESYELTFTYSLISCGVLVLNLANPSLLPTIVGPVCVAIVLIVAFIFSRYLKKIQYNMTSAKSKSPA